MTLSIFLTSCWTVKDLKDYSFYGKTAKVDPHKLKIDGAYYIIQGNYVQCFLLYQNGTYHSLFSHKLDSGYKAGLGYEAAIEKILRYGQTYHEKYAENIDMWGSFVIKSDTLHVQRFHSPATSEVYFPKVYDYKMRIVNNTTLVEIHDKLNEYHFYKTKNKPDSTNLFTTNERMNKKLKRLHLKETDNK